MAARDLRDRTIIITGASSGIGLATARCCAQAGMRLVLNARRETVLRDAIADVESHSGGVEFVPGDVTDAGMSGRLLDAATERFGTFDIVLSNAGYGVEMPVSTSTDDDWRRIFEVNFFASLDLLRLASRRLLDQRRPGHLLMTSSCLARFTMPFYSMYSASKACQAHVCRAMRLELKPYDIDVSCVMPITTRTGFHSVSRTESGLGSSDETVPEHAPKMFVQPPERVARAIMKCLRRPKAEVWTSVIVRTVAGVMTMAPFTFDLFMRGQTKIGHREFDQRRPPTSP